MAFMKRIFFFGLLNLFVIITLSILWSLISYFGGVYLPEGQYTSLMLFCLVWGMGGAFISLGISRIMAKMFMGVKVIDPNTRDSEARRLLDTVHQLARKSGLKTMPEVGVYESPELNAFATGPTKNRSLVAVSTGLLHRMNDNEVEGVLGHEIAHIANGDMVTMTLLQGVVNAFVMFFARIIASVVSQQVRDEARWIVYFVTTIVLEILFMFLGMFVVAGFSRWREYRADRGGARLAGRDKMISALRALQREKDVIVEEGQASVAALKISSRKAGGLLYLISTHPPLEERIKALERGSDQ